MMHMDMKLHFSTISHHSGRTVTGTLCGRENRQSQDGTNSTEVQIEVTCGHCLKIIADKKNWRHRKFLAAA